MTDTPPPPEKPTKIDPKRLDLVEQLYLKGKSSREIQRVVAAKYTCDRRTVRRYLRIVQGRLARQGSDEDPKELARRRGAARARAEALLLEAFACARKMQRVVGSGEDAEVIPQPDVKAMVSAAQRLMELDGVAAPTRLEHAGPGGGAISLGLETGVVVLPPEDAPPAPARPPDAPGTSPGAAPAEGAVVAEQPAAKAVP
jgi:hypothetical protein